MLPALALALTIAAPSPPRPDLDLTPAVEVRLLRGEGLVLEGRAVLDLEPRGPARRVHARSFIELGTGSAARLRWNTFGSLELTGSASLTVAPAAGEAPPRANLHHLHRAELELRRGSLAVALPGDWRLDMRRAAVRLEQRVTGGVELLHRGGEPLRLSRPAAEGERRPTVLWLRPGSRLRLGAR